MASQVAVAALEEVAAAEEACRVYVGNLLPRAKEPHLQAAFARFGVIHNVWIARKPPGFAFVRFASRAAAQRAVEGCRDAALEILGKPVRVQMAGEKAKKPAPVPLKQSEAASACHDAKERKEQKQKQAEEPRPARSEAQTARRITDKVAVAAEEELELELRLQVEITLQTALTASKETPTTPAKPQPQEQQQQQSRATRCQTPTTREKRLS